MTRLHPLRGMAFAIGAIAVVTTAIGIARARSQDSQGALLFARLEEGHWVALVDATTGATRRIYHSSGTALDALSIGPSQERIAVIEMRAEDRGVAHAPTNSLLVINPHGETVARVAGNVQRYTWCGDHCLAYIAGEYYEGGVGFKPTGAFVLNLDTREELPVPGLPAPYDLTWTPFDTSIYFKSIGRAPGENVFRFSLSRGTVSVTPYRDFGFSPSGKYYLSMRGEGRDTTQLYETRLNRPVSLPDRRTFGEPSGWVFAEGSFLLLGRRAIGQNRDSMHKEIRVGQPPMAEYTIYDVESRRVNQRLSGEIPPWARPRAVVPVVRGGRIDVIMHP